MCRRRARPAGGVAAWLAGAGVAAGVVVGVGGVAWGQGEPSAARVPEDDRFIDARDSRVSRYIGAPVRSVRVEPASAERPLSESGAALARNTVRASAGTPFDPLALELDVRRLDQLARFGRAEALIQPYDDGSVEVIYRLVEQPVVRDIQVTGNTRIRDSELAEQSDILRGQPVDRFQIDRVARRIEDLYREKGFYLVRVTIDERELAESGVLLYRIREGERVRITEVRFEGNLTYSDDLLGREIQTREAFIWRRGAIDEDMLEADVGRINRFYRDRGYLDIRTDWVLRQSPDGKQAIATFVIDEGPLSTLRSVRLEYAGRDEGEPVPFTAEQLAGLIPVKRGEAIGEAASNQAVAAVRQAFYQLGYTPPDAPIQPDSIVARQPYATAIDAEVLREPGSTEADLLIRVGLGERFRTGEVSVVGNTFTQSRVIDRELDLRPERVLDATDVSGSEQRIARSGLFAAGSVRISLKQPDAARPGYRDVVVEVQETNTGRFQIGGQVSSDSGASARLSLIERNFNLLDLPDSPGELLTGRAFRGAGQTFQIEALPGDRVETYTISLTEPALLDSDYSGSASVSYRNREFDEFTEERLGARLGVGRRLGTRWRGGVNARLERVNISSISPDRPVDVFAVEGETLLPGIGLSLSRTTLDSNFDPSRGTLVSLTAEHVGFGVDEFDFTRLGADLSLYIPLREDFFQRRTVFSITNRLGYIPQGQDDSPTFERFYLGGASFRGFEFRTISPKGVRNDTGEVGEDPVGGTWLFFLGAQIDQPLIEDVIRVVFFVDSGTVEKDFGFDEYRVSVGTGLRVVVPQLSPAPLAFDFGFPIVEQDGDEGRLFTFSVDVPF